MVVPGGVGNHRVVSNPLWLFSGRKSRDYGLLYHPQWWFQQREYSIMGWYTIYKGGME
jgi:hypothetical protein